MIIVRKDNGRQFDTVSPLNYGTVVWEGRTIYLLHEAQIGSACSGKWDDVFYAADGVDEDGEIYRVEWEITDTRREIINEIRELSDKIDNMRWFHEPKNEIKKIERELDVLAASEADESDACDWDNPASVEKL